MLDLPVATCMNNSCFTWHSLVVSLMASFCAVFFFQLDVLDEIWDVIGSVSEGFLIYPSYLLLNVVLLTGGFLLLRNFSVAISVSPHVCFILVLILISMFLR